MGTSDGDVQLFHTEVGVCWGAPGQEGEEAEIGRGCKEEGTAGRALSRPKTTARWAEP